MRDSLAGQATAWQGLRDEFGTFDWVQMHHELTPLPKFVAQKLGWAMNA